MNKEIINKINQFREDRNWKQFHNPKDLVISLNLEASELLEVFQWSSNEEVIPSKFDKIKEELADVLIYSYMIASDLDLDIDQIIEDKIKLNELKYPIDKAFNNKSKYNM